MKDNEFIVRNKALILRENSSNTLEQGTNISLEISHRFGYI